MGFLDFLVFLVFLDLLDLLDNLSTGWGLRAFLRSPCPSRLKKNTEAAQTCDLGMFSVQAQSAISAD